MSSDQKPQFIEYGWKVIIDVVLLAIVVIPIVVLRAFSTPFKRGFYCDDESIAHPHHTDTVSIGAVAGVAILLFCVCIPVIELIAYRHRKKTVVISGETSSVRVTVYGRHVHPYIVSVYQAVGAVCFGAALCQLTTDIGKYSLGRLRPHFLDVCKPNWGNFSCTDALGHMIYVQDDVCTQTDSALLKKARLSFPSGHASFSIYATVYFVIYLQVRMTWRHGPSLLKHFLQAVVVYMAFYTCLSRVSDYKHHWSDVVGGSVIGATVGLLTARYISNLFDEHKIQTLTKLLEDLKLLKPATFENNGTNEDIQLRNI